VLRNIALGRDWAKTVESELRDRNSAFAHPFYFLLGLLSPSEPFRPVQRISRSNEESPALDPWSRAFFLSAPSRLIQAQIIARVELPELGDRGHEPPRESAQLFAGNWRSSRAKQPTFR